MGAITYVLTDVLQLLKIVLLCNCIFMLQRKRKVSNVIVCFLSMLVVSFILYSCVSEAVVFVVYIVALCVFLCFLYDEKKHQLVFVGIWIYFFVAMLDWMFIQLFYMLFIELNYSNVYLVELLASIFSLILVSIAGKIYKNKYNVGIKSIGTVKLLLFSILAGVDAFVVTGLATILINDYEGNHKGIFFVLFFITIIGIVIQLSSVILLIISRDTYKEKDKITQKYLNEQIKHYKYLEQREQDTKKFRHDIKSHMQVLSTMAKEKKYSDFDKYMDEINVRINNFGNHITVNNGIVDAIINKYYSEAVRKGIHVEVTGMFPNICHVNAYDLCTIFSNVLSNAIEAAEKSAEKKITLVCRYTDTNIVVITKNTFKDEGQFAHSKIVSTKKDIEYHGFGIENIKEAVERNNGMLDIEIQNPNFSITIMLGNEEKENENCSSRRYEDVSQ